MSTIRALIVAGLVLAFAGTASAADWKTQDGGSTTCTVLRTDGVCYLTDIAEDSSAVNIRQCASFSITVYGTGASIMPQTCIDSSCTHAEPLLAAVLTGDSPNTFVTSEIAWDFIRIDWTAGGDAPTVAIKCGR